MASTRCKAHRATAQAQSFETGFSARRFWWSIAIGLLGVRHIPPTQSIQLRIDIGNPSLTSTPPCVHPAKRAPVHSRLCVQVRARTDSTGEKFGVRGVGKGNFQTQGCWNTRIKVILSSLLGRFLNTRWYCISIRHIKYGT